MCDIVLPRFFFSALTFVCAFYRCFTYSLLSQRSGHGSLEPLRPTSRHIVQQPVSHMPCYQDFCSVSRSLSSPLSVCQHVSVYVILPPFSHSSFFFPTLYFAEHIPSTETSSPSSHVHHRHLAICPAISAQLASSAARPRRISPPRIRMLLPKIRILPPHRIPHTRSI